MYEINLPNFENSKIIYKNFNDITYEDGSTENISLKSIV